MDKISENISTIDFKINDVVFTNIYIIDPKNDIDEEIIGVGSNSNHAGFSLTLNGRPIYPLKDIVLVD